MELKLRNESGMKNVNVIKISSLFIASLCSSDLSFLSFFFVFFLQTFFLVSLIHMVGNIADPIVCNCIFYVLLFKIHKLCFQNWILKFLFSQIRRCLK